MISAKRLTDGHRLKTGQVVQLVRHDEDEPEAFVVTLCSPLFPYTPIGRSTKTGLTRPLTPASADEAFYLFSEEVQ